MGHRKFSVMVAYDNAQMESLLKTLKYEEVHLANYVTFDDVTRRLPHCIDELYNKNGCIRLWVI